MPRAEVYSPKPLDIGSAAVTEVQVGNGDGTVIVLPDDNSVRIEFRR